MTLPTRIAGLLAATLSTASCTMPMPDEDAETRAITGDLMVPQRADLPADADLVVTFRGLQGEVLVEERSRVGNRESPFPFHLLAPADRIGTVTARVDLEDGTAWRSMSVLLDDGPNAVDLGPIALEEDFTPAAGQAGTARRRDRGAEDGGAEDGVAEDGVARVFEAPPPVGDMPGIPPADGVDEAAGPPETGPIRLTCGNSEITVVEDSGTAEVSVGDIVVEMEAAGAGRRYAVPDDPATYLSFGGEAVEVSFAGVALEDCRQAGAAG